MEIENVKETRREVIPETRGDQKIYKLFVEQEYYEENAKGIVASFKKELEDINHVLDGLDESKENAYEEADNQVDRMKEQVLKDLTLTKDEVWTNWKEECKKKQEWLNNIETFRANSKKALEDQFVALEKQLRTNRDNNTKGIEIWGAAVGEEK